MTLILDDGRRADSELRECASDIWELRVFLGVNVAHLPLFPLPGRALTPAQIEADYKPWSSL
jgi:hypothetical protein